MYYVNEKYSFSNYILSYIHFPQKPRTLLDELVAIAHEIYKIVCEIACHVKHSYYRFIR